MPETFKGLGAASPSRTLLTRSVWLLLLLRETTKKLNEQLVVISVDRIFCAHTDFVFFFLNARKTRLRRARAFRRNTMYVWILSLTPWWLAHRFQWPVIQSVYASSVYRPLPPPGVTSINRARFLPTKRRNRTAKHIWRYCTIDRKRLFNILIVGNVLFRVYL